MEDYREGFRYLLKLDLQYFAKEGPGGEKTEEPTGKRQEEARNKGNVAKSKELYSSISLLALFIIIKIYAGTLGTRFLETFYSVYAYIPDYTKMIGGDVPALLIRKLYMSSMINILLYILPFMLTAFVIAFVVNLVQVKWKITTEPMKPKFDKMNPINGFKRLFSARQLVELLKSAVMLVIIGAIAYSTLAGEVSTILSLYDMSIMDSIKTVGNIVTDMGIKVSAFYIIVGFADYFYQKHKHHEDLKMTKQEVKDEYKNAEGDPAIKSKQKQRMMEASRRRMMNAIPQSDFVITNPTHFAVALKYDPDVASAPYVVAKGEDFLAARIKEEAKAHKVEIVENKPLARML
nr:flagellar biosynthesis protein FlhB [Lachnospiraceae bacterium]